MHVHVRVRERGSERACTATRLVTRGAPVPPISVPPISMTVSKSCVGEILPSSYLVRGKGRGGASVLVRAGVRVGARVRVKVRVRVLP